MKTVILRVLWGQAFRLAVGLPPDVCFSVRQRFGAFFEVISGRCAGVLRFSIVPVPAVLWVEFSLRVARMPLWIDKTTCHKLPSGGAD